MADTTLQLRLLTGALLLQWLRAFHRKKKEGTKVLSYYRGCTKYGSCPNELSWSAMLDVY